MKQTGMLVVSLRGVHFGFWSRSGCSGQSANILSLGFREEKQVKCLFSSFFFFFKRPLLGVKICLCHTQMVVQGLNSKFPTSIPVCSIQESPPPRDFISHLTKQIVKPGTSSRTRGRMSRGKWRMKCTQSSTNFEASQSFPGPSCILIATAKKIAIYDDKLGPDTEPRSVTFFSA